MVEFEFFLCRGEYPFCCIFIFLLLVLYTIKFLINIILLFGGGRLVSMDGPGSPWTSIGGLSIDEKAGQVASG